MITAIPLRATKAALHIRIQAYVDMPELVPAIASMVVMLVVEAGVATGNACAVVDGAVKVGNVVAVNVVIVEGIWVKLDVTVLLAFMVIVVLAEPGSATASPVQLTNCQPEAGIAIMVTTWPEL